MRVLRLLGVAVACACVLAACGSSQWTTLPTKDGRRPPASAHNPHLLGIYVSLPLRGPQRANSAMILRGIHVALDQSYKGQDYRVVLHTPDGATPGQSLANAEAAASDPNTVFYIGDLDSTSTMRSLPILNQAGIMQISPGSPYPGLTTRLPPITKPGEPDIYYPTHRQTFLRLIPDDLVQAAAAIDELHSLHCGRVAAASFGSTVDGPALVKAVEATAPKYGLSTYGEPEHERPGTNTKNYPGYVDALRLAGVECFVLGGRVTGPSLALAKEIHAQMPSIPILGTSGLCNDDWLSALRSQDPSIGERLYCTSPIRPLHTFGEPGTQFAFDYRARYKHGPAPTAYALFGYQAAELAIDAFYELTPGRDNRAAVRQTLIEGTRFPAALGEYTFDANGDLASHDYGLWSAQDGQFRYVRTLKPVPVL